MGSSNGCSINSSLDFFETFQTFNWIMSDTGFISMSMVSSYSSNNLFISGKAYCPSFTNYTQQDGNTLSSCFITTCGGSYLIPTS